MEKVIKETPTESRQRVVEKLLGGQLCHHLLSYNQEHATKDKVLSACTELLGKISVPDEKSLDLQIRKLK